MACAASGASRGAIGEGVDSINATMVAKRVDGGGEDGIRHVRAKGGRSALGARARHGPPRCPETV